MQKDPQEKNPKFDLCLGFQFLSKEVFLVLKYQMATKS